MEQHELEQRLIEEIADEIATIATSSFSESLAREGGRMFELHGGETVKLIAVDHYDFGGMLITVEAADGKQYIVIASRSGAATTSRLSPSGSIGKTASPRPSHKLGKPMVAHSCSGWSREGSSVCGARRKQDAGLSYDVFVTDFGTGNEWVGICHAVMSRIVPGSRIIDLSHLIKPLDVAGGARLLADSLPYLPDDAVLLAVVDPNVGKDRDIAIQAKDGRFLVGPDNGLLSWAWSAAAAFFAPSNHFCRRDRRAGGAIVHARRFARLRHRCRHADRTGRELARMSALTSLEERAPRSSSARSAARCSITTGSATSAQRAKARPARARLDKAGCGGRGDGGIGAGTTV
jgi:hypothetical protein